MQGEFFERVASISTGLRRSMAPSGAFRMDATGDLEVQSALQALPTLFPQWVERLDLYDSDRFGPLLGVSDEGSAGKTIADAAHRSAKARALNDSDPSAIGVIIDGERMTSAGEVPIGPPEYREVVAAAFGRAHCSTNVGVRANVRHYQPLPVITVTTPDADHEIVSRLVTRFEPFVIRKRPLTVRLRGPANDPVPALRRIVHAIEKARRAGKFLDPDLHRFTFLLVFENEISLARDQPMIEAHIYAAAELGIRELALDAQLLAGARRRVTVQGLLNLLSPADLAPLLHTAGACGVRLTLSDRLDTASAARTIWTGLHTARTHGLSAGKYGLVPLTLEEQEEVACNINEWTSGWTAIPAFYVDTPLLTATDVYDVDRCCEAAVRWITAMASAGAKLLLVDSPDRINPRRLLKSDANDVIGVLTLDEVERLSKHAAKTEQRVLWSGGITPVQAYELAKRRVGGIFTTSSTATRVAVGQVNQRDPQLAEENEPTDAGVRRMHALIQGGFLVAVLSDSQKRVAIESGCRSLLLATTDAIVYQALKPLDEALIAGWHQHWGA